MRRGILNHYTYLSVTYVYLGLPNLNLYEASTKVFMHAEYIM